MPHAIITKYTTSRNGHSKVKVTGFVNSASYDWDAALSVEENHSLAVAHYVYELNKERSGDRKWNIISGGQMPDTSGYAFIIALK